MAKENVGTSRRRFIWYGWIAAAAIVVGEMISGTLALLWPKVRRDKAEGLLVAGKVDDFQVGKMVAFRREKLFINRTDEGLLAMSSICTHLRCIVPWVEKNNLFECPCHAGKFNWLGEVVGGPPPRPLDLHPVKIVAEKILVDTGTVIQRKRFNRSQLVMV
jgi:cytochrome b6-f complex iron-sulfur subunit